MPVVPILGAIFCLYLMTNLGWHTWARLVIWLAIGLVIFFAYSRHTRTREGLTAGLTRLT